MQFLIDNCNCDKSSDSLELTFPINSGLRSRTRETSVRTQKITLPTLIFDLSPTVVGPANDLIINRRPFILMIIRLRFKIDGDGSNAVKNVGQKRERASSRVCVRKRWPAPVFWLALTFKSIIRLMWLDIARDWYIGELLNVEHFKFSASNVMYWRSEFWL